MPRVLPFLARDVLGPGDAFPVSPGTAILPLANDVRERERVLADSTMPGEGRMRCVSLRVRVKEVWASAWCYSGSGTFKRWDLKASGTAQSVKVLSAKPPS